MLMMEAMADNTALVVEFEGVVKDVSFVDVVKGVLSGTTDGGRFDGDDKGDMYCNSEFTVGP